ncbi:hypothetical protein RN629_12025 [Sphingomonadaceae bacterium jetA1]|jgi:hypothetical protein|uniref:hypothetical protein n=1 Tax=Facivitalis istanbulensis TaxID=3075838 RepID=UPI00347815BF
MSVRDSHEGRVVIRWRQGVRIVLELLVVFGVLVALDHALTGGVGFAGVQPSPYWIPVLVMALAYGTGPGVAAAMIASALWLAGAHDDMGGRDYLDWLLHVSIPPLLWCVVAVSVGEVTLVRRRRLAKTERRAVLAVRDIARLTDAHERLTRTNGVLQRRIATDPHALGRIVAIATGLAALDPAARRGTIAQLIALAGHSEDFTCYRIGPDGARAWLRGGAVQGVTLGRPDQLPTAMIAAAGGDRRVRHVARAADREWLAGLGVAAVLLEDGEGALAGLLLFHDLPFEDFTAHRIAHLVEIAAWLGPMLCDATAGRAVRAAGLVA